MAQLFARDIIGPSSEYQEQLRREHSGSKWGSTGGKYSGADVLRVLYQRPYIQTVLDFGAGKASLEKFITERLGRQVHWTNYDPGIPRIDEIPNKQFDLVVTTDVLEHVEPDRVDDTIRLLGKLTGKVLYSDIACYPTGKLFGAGPYKGDDLHLTVETPLWWRHAFEECSGLEEFEYQWRTRRSKGGSKDRCMLVHERV